MNTALLPTTLRTLLAIALGLISTSASFAAVQVYDNPDLTTPPGDNPDDPNVVPAIGVWVDFNAPTNEEKVFVVDNLAGIEGRTGLDHGRFQLVWNTNFDPAASQVLVQGLRAFGNAVLGTSQSFSTSNGDAVTAAVLSPQRVAEGVEVGPALFAAPPGFTDSTGNPRSELLADFLEMAGTFGVWNPNLGRGFLAVRFNTGFIPGTQNYRYGYIDLTINPDYSITVHGIAWNDTPTQPITTAFIGASAGPDAPTNLSATALSANAVQLTWEEASSEDGFRIERRPSGVGAFAEIATVAANSTGYLDLTAAPETSYDYQVIATLGTGESPASNSASITTPVDSGPPAAPSGLTAAFSSVSVELNWTDNASNEAYFVIERSFDGEPFEEVATVPVDTTIYTDTQLVGGFTYAYRVRAENPLASANATTSVFLPDAASTIAADLVRDGAAYGMPDGSGWTVGLWDVAPALVTHQEFIGNRMNTVQGSGSDGHATHTSGTIIAAGTRDGAKGIVPAASIDFYTLSDAPSEIASVGMALPGEAGKLTVSNHSYRLVDAGWEASNTIGVDWIFRVPATGMMEDPRFGQYSSIVADVDSALFNVPYHLMVRSGNNDRDDGPVDGDTVFLSNAADTAGQSVTYDASIHPLPDGEFDDGYDSLNSESLAKNVLTVGSTGIAVRNRVTGALISASNVSASSAWGPADDGRIKPDVLALGESVFNADNDGDTIYSTRTGVSMAAASVSGAAALLVDYYHSLFTQYLRSSTLKALFIHTADDLATAGPDYSTGWGLVNTKRAADLIKLHSESPALRSIQEGRLTADRSVQTFTISAPGGAPLRATLTWLDPAGSPKNTLDNTTPDLVRDLDLRISDGTATYLPYVMPYALAPATASASDPATIGDNTTDNVEQIYVPSLPAGDYTLSISQKSIPSIEGSFYSLILSGHSAIAAPGESIGAPAQPTLTVEESADSYTVFGTGFQLGASSVTIRRASDATIVGSAEFVEVLADSIRFRLPSLLPDETYDILVDGVALRNAILASGVVGETYGAWIQENFDASDWSRPDIVSATADSEGDRTLNLLEYALGLSPDSVDTSSPVELFTTGTGVSFRIGLNFPMNTDAVDLLFTLEAKDALTDANWDDLALLPVATGSPAGGITPASLTDTAAPQDTRFIRLAVELVPAAAEPL